MGDLLRKKTAEFYLDGVFHNVFHTLFHCQGIYELYGTQRRGKMTLHFTNPVEQIPHI